MSAETPTNLRVLRKSRAAPRVGDVFAMQLPDDSFLFGRVVSTEAKAGPSMPGAILIYIYSNRFETCDEPERSALSPGNLLVAPIMTNRRPWSMGYFQTVANLPLQDSDRLDQHCFYEVSRKRYLDERGEPLPGPVEPVGQYALHSYRTIDDAVSVALGIPLAGEAPREARNRPDEASRDLAWIRDFLEDPSRHRDLEGMPRSLGAEAEGSLLAVLKGLDARRMLRDAQAILSAIDADLGMVLSKKSREAITSHREQVESRVPMLEAAIAAGEEARRSLEVLAAQLESHGRAQGEAEGSHETQG